MPVEIQSGPARVLFAGAVTAFAGQPVRLSVDLPEGERIVELYFSSSSDPEQLAVQPHYHEAGVQLLLVNFDRADGRGSAHPVLVADLGEELLMCHFRVHRYGRTPDRTVHLTLYRVPARAIAFADGPGTAIRVLAPAAPPVYEAATGPEDA